MGPESRWGDTEIRYSRDTTFRAMVDWMQNMIHQCQTTPTELREAAILACILYERSHGSMLFVLDDRPGELMSRSAAHCTHCGFYWTVPPLTESIEGCPKCRAPWNRWKRVTGHDEPRKDGVAEEHY